MAKGEKVTNATYMMAVPTLLTWDQRCLSPLQTGAGCPSGHPQQKCRVHGATAIASLFPRPHGGPAQSVLCRRAGLCHPPVSVSVSVTTPALQHSQLGPLPLLEERAAPGLKAASTYMGPQGNRRVKACPDSPAGPGE